MNLRSSFLLLLAPLVVGFHSSCTNHSGDGRSKNDSTTVGQSPQNPLFPLAVGKQWFYVTTIYDSLGKVTASHKGRTSVLKDTTVAGEKWYTLQDDSTQMPMDATNRRDGLYMLGQDGNAMLLYRYPAGVGDECPPYTVVSTDTAVSSPAGRFNCYQYECIIGGQVDSSRTWRATIDDFIAPGVGLVKHEVRKEWGEGARAVAGERDVTELVKQ